MQNSLTSYYQKAGRLLLLSMLVYTILPAVISCGTGLMALCDMTSDNQSSDFAVCCPSQNTADNETLPLITDLAGTANHCDIPAEKDDARTSDCGSCDCIITSSTTAALNADAVVQQNRSETSLQLEQLANQLSAYFNTASAAESESGITASVNASLSKAALQFEQRPHHTSLRIQHCSYLI